MIAPYDTPLALARDPLFAFFWVILAPVVFLTGGAMIATLFIPPFETGTEAEIAAYHTLWRTTCIMMAVWFLLMSLWTEWIGAGAFAGRVRAEARWLIIGVMVGPVLLILPSLIVGSVMTEDGWQYRQDINEAIFAPNNWSLAYIFIAVVMAPVVEEVTFRGIAFGALIARGLGPVAAVVLSSAAFAISHLQYSPAAMLVVFLSGVGFAILRLLSGTVIVPIVAHSVANADVLILNWLAASPAT
jgi:membrane protease YdiL (CAAX protease family)